MLSQVLVAFTIELDNEFERQMPHWTTVSASADSGQGPWLVSLVMWSNVLQYVGREKLTVGELQHLARTPRLNLAGMQRWGYIVVEPDPEDSRPKPPPREWIVRATAEGRRAQELWRRLLGVIELRWWTRFGEDEINRLRKSLWALVSQFHVELPDYLPVLGYGLFAKVLKQKREPTVIGDTIIAPGVNLPALLSKVLLTFTLVFERQSDLSLPIGANVIRLLDETGVRVRDLPRLSGVSKEAIQMAIGFLHKRGFIVVEPDAVVARTKLVRLTPKGRLAQDAYRERLSLVEERWREKFGKAAIHNLRESLEQLVGEPTPQLSPLFRGLQPQPDGWRASARKPDTLPHYPMVLHRGGYPDGS